MNKLRKNNFKMKVKLKNGIRLSINKCKNTASIINSPSVSGTIIIPEYYEQDGIRYNIVSIEKNSFENVHIDYLKFHENSHITTFKQSSFSFAHIKKIQIPVNLKKLKFGWCQFLYDVEEIEIPPENKNFKYYDHKYLLGKSSEKSDTFDVLYFARSDIQNAIIPSEVQILSNQSFYSHKQLKSIVFTEDSQLKNIKRAIFYEAPIEKLVLPSSVEEIEENCFDCVRSLINIEVSPKNKIFSVFKNKILLRKSDPISSENFDVITFAARDIKEVEIPSNIKYISRYSFDRCESLKSIKFEENSQLELIGSNSFSFIYGPENLIFS